MPRIIVKCRYYKNAMQGNLGGLMKYIATREGVEKVPQERRELPATENQKELINELILRNDYLKQNVNYKTYVNEPTRGNASEFISSAVESNPHILETEYYLSYIATRPRAEKIGSNHGLFSFDDNVDLDKETACLEAHAGNVYSVIVSLKREDAERLGYNNAKSWRDLIRKHTDLLAHEHHIPIANLKWFGAFHNEAHHPHVHILLYSTAENDKSYLSKKGVETLRKTLADDIFRDELLEIYDRQTRLRKRITDELRDTFRELANRISSGNCFDETLLAKIEQLARRLNSCSGKMQYGYLPKGIKALVDEIVDEVGQTGDTAILYDLWYQAKCSVYATYSGTPPEKLPLSREKELNAIRNALVYEAAKLGEELVRENDQSLAKPVQTQSSESHQGAGNSSNKAAKGSASKLVVAGAAMRFASSLARTFYDSYKKYDPDEDDIDRKLRREIRAVKNGENMTM